MGLCVCPSVQVLLARMFHTLPDAFRFFLALSHDPSLFLSDSQLETCFITPAQLRMGLHQLLLQASPHPAPLSPSRRNALSGERTAASWHADIDDIIEEVTLGFRAQLSLLDFMRMFEWDYGLGAETQLQIAVNRRHLEYQVRMEIKEKLVVGKWKFFSMAIRARVIYWRWMFLLVTFAWNDWRACTATSRERKRKEALAAAYAREVRLRRVFEFWNAWALDLKAEREQVVALALQYVLGCVCCPPALMHACSASTRMHTACCVTTPQSACAGLPLSLSFFLSLSLSLFFSRERERERYPYTHTHTHATRTIASNACPMPLSSSAPHVFSSYTHTHTHTHTHILSTAGLFLIILHCHLCVFL